MLRRHKAAQSFNTDQRIHNTNKPWVVAKQKDENDPCILDCNQSLALGDFICKIYKSLGKDIIIQKFLRAMYCLQEQTKHLNRDAKINIKISQSDQKLGETSITGKA